MSHIALYRKYRPNTFDTIVAQDHITKILKRQIMTDKVGHAYIFSGSRGTGKTSAAKVFARAVNCLNPVDGNPCNECVNCLAILNGTTSDIVEMDAASNNGVDDIREIRQEVVYAATTLKYRVYIIDEAHMLTPSAFNAFLKTLEEPPKGVIFIMATTEPHKILPTITSRCLRFDFKRIPENKIYENLAKVLNEENKKFDEKSLKYIAKAAEGGMRDALSILDRCIDESDELKFEEVEELIGAIPSETLKKLVFSIIEYNPSSVLAQIEKIINDGKEVRQLANELLNTFMQILQYFSTDSADAYTIFDKEDLEKLKQITDVNRINSIICTLNEMDNDIRFSTNSQIIFKARIITLAMRKEAQSVNTGNVNYVENSSVNSGEINELKEEIEILKEEIEDLKAKGVNIVSAANANTHSESAMRTFRPWKEVKEKIAARRLTYLYSILERSTAKVGGDVVYIFVENQFSREAMLEKKYVDVVAEVIEDVTERYFEVQIKVNETKQATDEDLVEKTFKEKNVDYEEI